MADYYLNSFRVSTPYGVKDSLHPDGHDGIDFAGKTAGAAAGMNIPSLSGGKVVQVFNNNKTAGNGVIIQTEDGTNIRYIHMKNAPKFKVGDTVNVGQSLGQIGSTGRSTGPHLDLTVTKGGKNIDPMTIINQMSNAKPASNSGGAKTGGSSYTNTYKTKKEALKAPGYQDYKANLSKALQTGKVPESWVVGLTELIGRESTWNSGVKNPKPGATAYGYGQFINSTRQEYEARMGLSYDNPVSQIIMTAQYVKDRYGTPEKALKYWDANGHY